MPYARLFGRLLPVLLVSSLASASGPDPVFRRFSVEEGLSQGTITTLLQDRQGFMWIGTQDGLNRFDGTRFTVFRHDPQDSTTLANSWITALYEDDERVLWVATPGDLHRLDRASGVFVRVPMSGPVAGSSPKNVVALRTTGRGPGRRIWFGTPALHFIDSSGVMRRAGTAAGGGGLRARTILSDGHGRLWIAGGDTVMAIDPSSGEPIRRFALEQGARIVSASWAPPGGRALLLGGGGGIFALDTAAGTVVRLYGGKVGSIVVDGHGTIWAGLVEGGLLTIAPEGEGGARSIHRNDPRDPASLSDDGVMTMCEDSEGGIWVGTFNGLNRFDEYVPVFTTYRHDPGAENSLSHDFVLSIMEDARGDIWFGTFGGGVSILRGGTGSRAFFAHLRSSAGTRGSLCSDNVRSLHQDREGIVWIGTANGITRHDPTTGVSTCLHALLTRPQRLVWADALCETRSGRLIAGATSLGLLSIERAPAAGSAYTAVPLAPSDSSGPAQSSEVRWIIEDRRAFLWAATEAGLVRFDPVRGTQRRFVHDPRDSTSLSSDAVWSILEDPADSAILWVGTGNGLNRFDVRTGRSRRYFTQPGFPNGNVYGILCDDEGRLWLSTNHGLTCFDDREPEGRKFRNYDGTDGLPGNEFNRHAFKRLRNGEFLFGGTRGVTRFHPSRIRTDPHPPGIVLTAFMKFGRPVRFDRAIGEMEVIELSHDEQVFAFEYAALEYTKPSGVRFATMLEGLDAGWVDAGDRRYAAYTHLDPGAYTFRVKASNRDGVWDEKGVAIRLVINPPWWGTWWFRLLSISAVAGLLAAAHRRRTRILEREQRLQREYALRLLESQDVERKRIAGELHDSLGQDLLVVRNRALVGLREPDLSVRAKNHLDEIAAVTAQALENVRGISHGLHPYHLDHLGLSKAVAALGAALSRSSPVRFHMQVEDVDSAVPRDRAIHLYRIVQEAATNVIRHSGAAEATVSLREEHGGVVLEIADGGKGLPRGADGRFAEGFGLTGIRERVAILGGLFQIESRTGAGTTLKIRVPKEKTGK